MLHSAATLERGLVEGLHLKPLLAKTSQPRVINIFELNNSNLETLGDTSAIQNVLQDHGVFVSVKEMAKGCNDCNVENCKKGCCLMKPLRKTSFETCMMQKVQLYIRVSAWSYSTQNNFDALNLVLGNNLSLVTSTTAAIRHQFLFISDLYERLFSTIKTEAFFLRAERLRHHPIFYFAHTAVFYVNKLVVSGFLDRGKRIDPR